MLVSPEFFIKCAASLMACTLVGCSTLPGVIDQVDIKQTCNGDDEIYVISHGWHTGIAVKSADLNRMLPELSARFPNSGYYEIGWGDAGFYQANEITTELTLRAMFWSSGSVIHVAAFNDNPKLYFSKSEVRVLNSNPENYQNLLLFLKSSFYRDASGDIIKERRGIYGDSQFYSGSGRYQLFNTCNKWTAKALRSAGYELSSMFKLTSSSVMNSLGRACL